MREGPSAAEHGRPEADEHGQGAVTSCIKVIPFADRCVYWQSNL
jgi:hypothetical protein